MADTAIFGAFSGVLFVCALYLTAVGTWLACALIGYLTWDLVAGLRGCRMCATVFIFARAVISAIVCISVPMTLTNPITYDCGLIMGYLSSVAIGVALYMIGLAIKPAWRVLRWLSKHNSLVAC